MLHHLTMGHLDPVAIKEGRRLVVTRPLDRDVVARLLDEFAKPGPDGRPPLDPARVKFHDGYIVCPWLMPHPVPGVTEFARRLQEKTGCILADVNCCAVVERDNLLNIARWERELSHKTAAARS
jgi:hypothetical protein